MYVLVCVRARVGVGWIRPSTGILILQKWEGGGKEDGTQMAQGVELGRVPWVQAVGLYCTPRGTGAHVSGEAHETFVGNCTGALV